MKGLKPGDKVSFLTLIERVYIKGYKSKGRFSWRCRCVCGEEVIRREDLFSENKSMSCGCQHPSLHTKGSQNPHWTGFGEISGSYFAQIIHGATARGWEFALTIKELWDLFLQQKEKCGLTGRKLVFST